MDFRKDSDFLSDDSFILWRLSPTEESDAFWSEFGKNNPALENELDSAIAKLAAVRVNDYKLSKEDSDRLLQRIIRTSAVHAGRKRIVRFSVAAACVAAAVVSALSVRHSADSLPPVTTETIIGQELPTEDIRLISGNDVITFMNNTEINVSETVGGKDTENPEEIMNTLIVPRGRVTTLVLSDGSKVWVNSGTEIAFPSKFTGSERRITVDGEIYIDVRKDDLHPFFVETSEFTVRVYGTRFNVFSYADSPAKSVALEDGKVEIRMGNKSQYLNPSELFTIEQGVASISHVDVAQYISWKDGFLILDKVPISEIFEKIGRYYNVGFKQSSSALLNRTVSGKLILSDDINEILQVLCPIANITCERLGDSIYINNKL